MSTPADRVQARLKWFAACERMMFALNPPVELIKGAPIDIGLQEAVQVVDEALDELSAAFGIDRSAL